MKKLLGLTLAMTMLFSVSTISFASNKPASEPSERPLGILTEESTKTYTDENGFTITETLQIYEPEITPYATKMKTGRKIVSVNSDLNATILVITLDADFYYGGDNGVTSDRYYSSYEVLVPSAVKSYKETNISYNTYPNQAAPYATIKTSYEVVEVRSTVTGNTQTYKPTASLKCTYNGTIS